MKFKLALSLLLASLLAPLSSPGAEPVTGEACYGYGLTETLLSARFIALSLAKRNALESYAVYTDATANMQDALLKNEIISNLTVRVLKGIEVTEESENPAERQVCRTITAEVEPERVKNIISAVYYAFYNKKGSLRTGLPANDIIRLIKAEEISCPYDFENRCLKLVAECQRNSFGESQIIRIIWYDGTGLPSFSINERMSCHKSRDINTFFLRLPPDGETFTLDLP